MQRKKISQVTNDHALSNACQQITYKGRADAIKHKTSDYNCAGVKQTCT